MGVTRKVTLRAALTGSKLGEKEVHPDDTVGNLRPLVLAAARQTSMMSRLSEATELSVCPRVTLLRFDLCINNKVLFDHQLICDCLECEESAEGGFVDSVDVVYLPAPCLGTACGSSARIWNLSAPGFGTVLDLPSDATVRKITFMPDQQHVVTSSDDGTARLWRLDGGECVQTFQHPSSVSDLACSSNSELLLTLSNGHVSVWRIKTGTCIWHLENVYILQALFIPQTEEVLSIADETPKIWNLQRSDPIASLEGHSAVVLSALCFPNGERICSGALDRSVRLWQREVDSWDSWKCLRTLHGHFDGIRALALSRDFIASASGCTARVWCAGTGSCDSIINDHAGSIHCMQFSSDGYRLLVAYGCGREVFNIMNNCSGVKLWCIASKQCLASIQTGDFVLFAQLLDGQNILVASSKRVEMWQSGQRLLDLQFRGLRAFAIS